MGMTQINARISASVKLAGDAALNEAGYTPTQAIRALWEYAGRNRGNEKELRRVFDVLEGKNDVGSRGSEVARRLQIAAEGPLIAERALSEMGIDPAVYSDDAADKDLLEQALLDKMRERGLDR